MTPRPGSARSSAEEPGSTPLLDAASSPDRSLREVEALLAVGASVEERDENGATVLHVLAQAQGEQCQGDWPARTLRCLLDAGADLEAVTAWGWTPLTSALVECDELLVRALLEAGANPDVRFSQRSFPSFARGWTLAHYCLVQPNGRELLQLLVDHKVDLGRRNDTGETVLELCAQMLREPEEDMDEEFLDNVRACEVLLRGLG